MIHISYSRIETFHTKMIIISSKFDKNRTKFFADEKFCEQLTKFFGRNISEQFFSRRNFFPLRYIILSKTHNWVEWTAPSVSLSQTKVNDINLNDRPRMQNDIENEIGRSLFPFIHGLRILISFDYLHQSHRQYFGISVVVIVSNQLLSSESLY